MDKHKAWQLITKGQMKQGEFNGVLGRHISYIRMGYGKRIGGRAWMGLRW